LTPPDDDKAGRKRVGRKGNGGEGILRMKKIQPQDDLPGLKDKKHFPKNTGRPAQKQRGQINHQLKEEMCQKDRGQGGVGARLIAPEPDVGNWSLPLELVREVAWIRPA